MQPSGIIITKRENDMPLEDFIIIEKVRARDLWHFTDRFVRKRLSHTTAVLVNHFLGRKPPQCDGLIMD